MNSRRSARGPADTPRSSFSDHPHLVGARLAAAIIADDFEAHTLIFPKRVCIHQIICVNVRARTKELVLRNDDGLMPWPSSPRLETAEERRLQEAEEVFRQWGSRFDAFARTEWLAVFVLHLLRFRPEDAAKGFIGLSNSIGEYGQTRHESRNLVERSLKAPM
jgi:hypothetical protein